MDNGKGKKILVSILVIVLVALLIISIVRVSYGSDTISFNGFLDYLSSCPTLSFSYSNVLYISGEWAILDGLRVFLNNIMIIPNFLIWVCKNLYNVLLFVFYFTRYLFI